MGLFAIDKILIENHTNIMSLNKAFSSMTFTEWRDPQGRGIFIQHLKGSWPIAESVIGGGGHLGCVH